MNSRSRTYSELRRFGTLEERFEYLKLGGGVCVPTFRSARWMNQRFYTSLEWRQVRDVVILRDNGCDLGVDGYEIRGRILIHHMNPLTRLDIELGDEDMLDPEYLISTTHRTHNAIHYGDVHLLPRTLVERHPGDTKLW